MPLPVTALAVSMFAIGTTEFVIVMALFVLGNILCGAAPNFTVLLVARLLTSFTHAAFVGAASSWP
jgi:DHA1 family inner membrane transport protein